MNMGIQDAFNLAWKLSLVLRNGGNPQLLDSYEAERKPVDEAVIRQTDRATRLISLHGSVTRFVRDHLMSLLTRIPTVEERLGEGLSGIAAITGTAQSSRSMPPEWPAPPRVIGRPMRRSSRRRTGHRYGSTSY
jgi:hypothetical protein